MTSPVDGGLERLRPKSVAPVSLASLAAAFGLTEVDAGAAPSSAQTTVTGVTVASNDAAPGDLFIGIPGAVKHGARFAADAVANGASAIVTDAAGLEFAQNLGVPVLLVEEPRTVAGPIANVVYDSPSRDIVTLAVTGTNGKTTTSHFIAAALEAGLGSVGLFGTIELRLGDARVDSSRTTLEAPVQHRLMAVARELGVASVVTEASSHGISLHRLADIQFDVAVFTNLQHDHLDFHGTMDDYFAVKASLFSPEISQRGVAVIDDEWGLRLAQTAQIPVSTVSTHPTDDSPEALAADWRVLSYELGLDGGVSSFELRDPDGGVHTAYCPIPGVVNITNAATAIAAAVAAGVEVETAVKAIGCAPMVPGRMQRIIDRGHGLPLCLVDYAHTPEALEYALGAVRPITAGKLVLVFGSDGDRDQEKRPELGEVAARLADVLVVTDENPRSEDPATIRAAVLDGVRSVRPDLHDVTEITTSRADALRQAVAMCREGDTVIVTGKGHELTQEIAGVFHDYNDADVYRAIARGAGVPTL